MGEARHGALFERREAKGRLWYKLYAASVLFGVCLIWVYRVAHMPKAGEERLRRVWWLGMFAAELFFGFYWVLTQSVRWCPIYYHSFKDRLSQRYTDEQLPPVDIFVCTADPKMEPPMLVINTILSVMAYDYPQKKLSIYLSDDGGSEFTFYALLEAATFSKHWIPFCRKFKVEPRSPVAYFSSADVFWQDNAEELLAIKKLYNEMENRVEAVIKLGRIPGDIAKQHKGFSAWDSQITPHNHPAIVKILIDGMDPSLMDAEGIALPTLVYLSREKRPNYSHNFKAGAMNALVRVSSKISNAPIILNVDCDMYSNSSQSVRDALCFFMDEEDGHKIAYVQYPQNFVNLHKKNTYGDTITVVNTVELAGAVESLYIGTGCFHRRESLCGRKYCIDKKETLSNGYERIAEESTDKLEERAKIVATCSYEDNTEWGKNMGLMYGFVVEDIVTGLSIQGRGWKSIYFNPARKGFLGIAPSTLELLLVQQKRWSEGLFQIFASKYCPFLYGHGKIKLRLQMAYSIYLLWAPLSLPVLYYVIIPSLCLLNGIPLFPRVSSSWFIPFAYIITATQAYSLSEALWCGETVGSWWNMQKMRLMKRTSSYFFGFMDFVFQLLGISKSSFTITAKVADDDEASKRFEEGIMEFGSSSPMFTILSTLAMLNLFCFLGGLVRAVTVGNGGGNSFEQMALQFLLCGLLVLANLPIYQGLFLRKDRGRLPSSVAFESAIFVALICVVPLCGFIRDYIYLYY